MAATFCSTTSCRLLISKASPPSSVSLERTAPLRLSWLIAPPTSPTTRCDSCSRAPCRSKSGGFHRMPTFPCVGNPFAFRFHSADVPRHVPTFRATHCSILAEPCGLAAEPCGVAAITVYSCSQNPTGFRPEAFGMVRKGFWVMAKKEGAECSMKAFGSSSGRDDKTRTCDLAPPRRVRYQLRYIPFLSNVSHNCAAKV